jgi:zinc protease
MNEVRVNQGLTYGVSSYFYALPRGGYFGITTFTRTESTRKIIDVSLTEVEKLREKGTKAAELKRAQDYAVGVYPLRTETNESIAGGIADIRLYGLGEDWIEQYRSRLKNVSGKQTSAMAKKYLFTREKPLIVLVGKASEVKGQLKGLGKVTVVPASEYE